MAASGEHRVGGTELHLLCSDETDGFLGSEAGADDIKVELTTDGILSQTIENSEIGDFDEGDTRSLEPWLQIVRYVDSFKVELIEEDDLRTTTGPGDDPGHRPGRNDGGVQPDAAEGGRRHAARLVPDRLRRWASTSSTARSHDGCPSESAAAGENPY